MIDSKSKEIPETPIKTEESYPSLELQKDVKNKVKQLLRSGIRCRSAFNRYS